ncbi:hypothetical protein [Gemmata massiliana]|uniref:hypothetical protein n=1 Tax=Gemmata massiliana TaxID=1210884 RepID=UPI0013A695E4|nr:hypothetical protein [Gemmata massiliana]
MWERDLSIRSLFTQTSKLVTGDAIRSASPVRPGYCRHRDEPYQLPEADRGQNCGARGREVTVIEEAEVTRGPNGTPADGRDRGGSTRVVNRTALKRLEQLVAHLTCKCWLGANPRPRQYPFTPEAVANWQHCWCRCG